jgi:UTP--glucose-1-phosphate uridylyltransferase
VVPAAGLGTRLRPLSDAIPKELLPIGRRPVLAYVLEELRGAGITDVLFVVSERKPQIRALFGDALPAEANLPAMRIDYTVQAEQRGLGDAVLQAEAWADGEPFVVAFGDCLIEAGGRLGGSTPLRRIIDTQIEHGAAATTCVERVPWERVSRYGVLAPEKGGESAENLPFRAVDIIEKPGRDEAPSNLVVAARWVFQPEIFAVLRGTPIASNGELQLTDAVRISTQSGNPLWAAPLQPGEFRRDIGGFDSFFAAFVRAALADPEYGEAARRAAREILARSDGPSASTE